MARKKTDAELQAIKAAARLLFMEGYKNNEIASIFDVSEVVVSKWRTSGKWDEERADKRDLEQDNIKSVQKLLKYNLEVLLAKSAQFNDLPLHERPLVEKKDLDSINRMMASVKDSSITFSLASRVCRQLLAQIFETNVALAKQVQPYFHDFINAMKDTTH